MIITWDYPYGPSPVFVIAMQVSYAFDILECRWHSSSVYRNEQPRTMTGDGRRRAGMTIIHPPDRGQKNIGFW